MFLAIDGNERKVKPEPKNRAKCPACQSGVLAKCGRVKAWHWAHESGSDCDPWSEMTPWHLEWQEKWPDNQREMVIGRHRADVVTIPRDSLVSGMARLHTERPLVVEFQHSHLSADEIEEREYYYKSKIGQLVWVWDVSSPYSKGYLSTGSPNSGWFTWKWFKSSLKSHRCPVFLDVGSFLLFIKGWPEKEWVPGDEWFDVELGDYRSGGHRAWGSGNCQFVSKSEFVRALTVDRSRWAVKP